MTQVLNDGTNNYIYGNGRIAQVNTNTEYFLGDALGSVRQLTNSNGAVTYATAYDPYGVTTQTSGSSETAYGYTNEYASQGLVYLRSRYYAPGIGRFLTRDTWEGDANQPMSYNRWMYVKGNTINAIDPSGYFDIGPWCSDDIPSRVAAAEKYVSRTHAGHLIFDELNTYTAGGIGVQCHGSNVNREEHYSGEGIAQVTDMQVATKYGDKIFDSLGNFRGCGLSYQGEEVQDQNQPAWAVHYMRRQIQQVLEACDKWCTSTDKFIAAALAQNGPGFSHYELTQTVLNRKPKNPADLYRYLNPNGDVDTNHPDKVTADWVKYFKKRNNPKDTYLQLSLFAQVVFALQSNPSPNLRWYVPQDLNWNYIWILAKP